MYDHYSITYLQFLINLGGDILLGQTFMHARHYSAILRVHGKKHIVLLLVLYSPLKGRKAD